MIALDTNILVYASQNGDPQGRHGRALALLERLGPANAILPLQVIGEYMNVCRSKSVLPLAAAAERVAFWYHVFECPASMGQDFILAAGVSEKFDLQYFDALIIAVARRAGATALLTEDMQDGLEVEGLKIINPFVPENETLLADFLGSVP